MPIRNFVNRKIGLSTDIKPIARFTPVFNETDTGDTYVTADNDASYVYHSGKDKVDVLRNKEIDAQYNTIPNLQNDSPFAIGSQVKGGVVPAVTVDGSFYGVLDGLEIHNPRRILNDPTNGALVEFYGSNVEPSGYMSKYPVASRADGYSIKGEFKSAHTRMLVGFSYTKIYSTYGNVFFNNDIGVAIGFTSDVTNYCVYSNDGAGVPATPIAFPTVKDQLLHTFEISLNLTNVVCKLDNDTITVTTQIPPLTTQLYLSCYGIG